MFLYSPNSLFYEGPSMCPLNSDRVIYLQPKNLYRLPETGGAETEIGFPNSLESDLI